MKILPILVTVAALSGAASSASACDELVALDKAQTIDLINTIRDDAADPLTQLFAFETLACSDQSGVRDLALRTALTSSNDTIKGQVLLRAMTEKEVIAVKLLEVEGLSKEQYERIKARPFEMLGVTFVDVPTGCLSFHRNDHCPAYSSLSVQGTLATIHVRWNGYNVDGAFELEGDKLTGTFSIGNQTYPAQIALF